MFQLMFQLSGSLIAYINPGTGSLFIQLLFVGIAGGFLTLKSSWSAIKQFFTKEKREK